MAFVDFFKPAYSDLLSVEDQIKNKKRALFIGGGVFILLLPTIPAFFGGAEAYLDAINENRKISEKDLKMTREQIKERATVLNQDSLWQVRQTRINDDFKKDIEILKSSSDNNTKLISSKMDELSLQIAKNDTKLSNNPSNEGQVQLKVQEEKLPLSYDAQDNKRNQKQDMSAPIPISIVVPETQTTPRQVLNGNLVLPKPPQSFQNQNNNQGNQQQNSYNMNTFSPAKIVKGEYRPPVSITSNTSKISTLNSTFASSKPKEEGDLVIPMGASKGILLTGSTLKTLEAGKSEPKVVFIKLDDKFVSSNETKLKLKGCVVQGAAVGDFGTGTAEIRVSSIQCTARDKKGQEYIAETESLKAWVFDESNLYGVESRVVSKEGEIFAKSIPLALLNTGMSMLTTAANNYTSKQTTNADGTTTVSAPAVQTVSSETSNIMTRITDLWLKYLDSITPVVQFRAGRTVTVAFSGITKLQWKKVEFFDSTKPLKTNKNTLRRNYEQY